MTNWSELVQKLPDGKWESLDYALKFAYLKTFIPWTNDEQYGYRVRDLKEFLKS